MNIVIQVVRRSTFLILLLATWFLLSRFGPWPSHLFPGPDSVLKDFVKMLRDGRLVRATLHSMGRMTQGYLISVAIGIPLGIATARFKVFRDSVIPVLMGFRGLPSSVWRPLQLLCLGMSHVAVY